MKTLSRSLIICAYRFSIFNKSLITNNLNKFSLTYKPQYYFSEKPSKGPLSPSDVRKENL